VADNRILPEIKFCELNSDKEDSINENHFNLDSYELD
jgi:hypothetical protein